MSWSGLPEPGEETIEIEGRRCVVVHLAQSEQLPLSACVGLPFLLPDPDDKRPVALCEACRLKLVAG